MLMRNVSLDLKWNLNLGALALMWRGGCIIRSRFLGDIKSAYDRNPEPEEPLARRIFRCTPSRKPKSAGARRSVWPRIWEFQPPRSPMPWHFMMPTAAPVFLPTCSKDNATTSARTPTSGSISPAASSSTQTGPAWAAPQPPLHTTFSFFLIHPLPLSGVRDGAVF